MPPGQGDDADHALARREGHHLAGHDRPRRAGGREAVGHGQHNVPAGEDAHQRALVGQHQRRLAGAGLERVGHRLDVRLGGHGHILGRHQAVDRALRLDARLGDPFGHVVGQQRPVRDQALDELAHVALDHCIAPGLGQRPALLGQLRKTLGVLGQPALARLRVAAHLRREAELGRRGDQLFVGGIDHPARVGQIVGGDKGPSLVIQDALDAPFFSALFGDRRVGVCPLDDQPPAPDAVEDHRRVGGRVQPDVIGHRGSRDEHVRRLAQQIVARVAELDRRRGVGCQCV